MFLVKKLLIGSGSKRPIVTIGNSFELQSERDAWVAVAGQSGLVELNSDARTGVWTLVTPVAFGSNEFQSEILVENLLDVDGYSVSFNFFHATAGNASTNLARSGGIRTATATTFSSSISNQNTSYTDYTFTGNFSGIKSLILKAESFSYFVSRTTVIDDWSATFTPI